MKGWARVSLGDVCLVRKGTVITEKATRPGSVPVVSGGMTFSYTHAEANRPSGVITVSASGANAGFVNIWHEPIYASDCSTVEPLDPATVDPRFMFHRLKSLQGWIQAALRRGAAQPHVYPKDLAAIEFLLPPLEEQRRIVKVMDSTEAVAAHCRQVLTRLGSLTHAVFIEALSQVGREGGPRETIESILASRDGAMRTGPFGSQLLHEEFVEEGVAVLGIDNVVSNQFKWGTRRFITLAKYEQLKRYTVSPGDVLVTIMGTCGRAAIVPTDIPTAINTKHLCCITVDQERCLPEWLWANILFHPRVRQQLGATHGAVMPGLNMGKLRGCEVSLPNLDVQRRFAQQKAAVERQLALVNQMRTQLEVLASALRQRAFRGEL